MRQGVARNNTHCVARMRSQAEPPARSKAAPLCRQPDHRRCLGDPFLNRWIDTETVLKMSASGRNDLAEMSANDLAESARFALRGPFDTPIILQERSMRCGQSLQRRCMPGVGRSKIQPGRPRICEVLGRSLLPWLPSQTTSAQVAE